MTIDIDLPPARRAEIISELLAFRCIPHAEPGVSVDRVLAEERQRCNRLLDRILATLARGQGALVHDTEIAAAVDKARAAHQGALTRETARFGGPR